MNILGFHVARVVCDDQPYLFDTLNKRYFPHDLSTEELQRNMLLATQEDEAIHRRIFVVSNKVILNVCPTLQCNLRCTHCFMSNRLVDRDFEELDLVRLLKFCERLYTYHPFIMMRLSFPGGEPLLKFQTVQKVCEAIERFASQHNVVLKKCITTNLAVSLSEEMLHTLKKFDHILVSVDGLEANHNQQRVPNPTYEPVIINPFEQTISNIKKLMLNKFRDQLSIQAALSVEQETLSYYKDMLKLGLKKDSIHCYITHPTKKNPTAQPLYLEFLKHWRQRLTPCCKYKYMSHFYVYANKLYTDPYVCNELTSIDAEISEIEEKSKSELLQEMPVLHDPKCRKCPALGFCWGGCAQNNGFFGTEPSKYCDQESVIQKMVDIINREGPYLWRH